MDESKLEKQRTMVTKSSIKRKPLTNLSNIVRKPNHTSSSVLSKKPVSSTASGSSIGSTQNPINVHRPIVAQPDQSLPSKPHRFTPDHLSGDENQIAQALKHMTPNTRSKTKAAVPFHQTYFQETRNSVNKGSVSFCSSTFDKFKHQGKINQSSTEKINGKRKPVDTPVSVMKNTSNNSNKDKGKENVVQSNTGLTMADSLMKRKDKGKAIADSTPVKYNTLEKRNQQISCPPILRTMNNRNDADVEDVLPSKLQTEPPSNRKKRRCSAKEVAEEYTLPKEFLEQQRAYFKEIDEFELQVEEV